MPPDDNLGVDPNNTAQPGSEPTQSEGGAAGASTAPAMNADQLEQVFAEALATGNQPVLEAIQQLGQALAQSPARSQYPEGGAPAESDLAERLLTDPDNVLNEKMNEWARNNLSVPLTGSFEADRDERIESRAAEIDLELGDGYFDENIRPRLDGPKGNLSAFPIHQQANPKVIDSAINAILGNDYRDPNKRVTMDEARAKVSKAKEERNVATPPNMMGPGRSATQRSDKLTPDLQEALAGFQKAGVPITEKSLKNALNRENTLEGWRQQQTTLKGASQ